MVTWVHQIQPPNGISIGLAVFAGLTNVTNRQTDRPRYSVSKQSVCDAAYTYVTIIMCIFVQSNIKSRRHPGKNIKINEF